MWVRGITALLFSILAITTPVNAAELRWGLAGELLYFDYREFDNHERELNHEFGTLPGVRATVEARRQRWFTRLDAAFQYGRVTYDGETQSGRPVVSTTRTRLFSLSAQPGYWLDPARQWGLFLHLARRQWDRDIQPTGSVQGLYERYRWSEAGAGIRHVFNRAQGSGWGHEVRLTGFATLDGTVFVDLSSLGGSNLDDITLGLGESLGGRIRYTASHLLETGHRLRISPWFAAWRFGRSGTRQATRDGSPAGLSVFEPRSESWRVGLTMGVDF